MELTKSSRLNKRYIPILIIICISFLLSILGFFVVHNYDLEDIEDDFNIVALNSFLSLQREIEKNFEVLRSLHSLYLSSEFVSREEFRTFCKSSLLRHDDIQALEWIPRVVSEEREGYEKNAQIDGYQDFQITKRETQGKMVRADESKEYFPVYYVEPYRGNELALGFDLATNPARLKALHKSRDTGEMVATSRITLVQEKGNQYGLLVFLPVYRNQVPIDTVAKRHEALIGFVLGVFRIGDIVEKSLALVYLRPKGVDIHLFDKSSSQDEQFLYTNISQIRRDIDQTNIQQEVRYNDGLHVSHTFSIADRKWLMVYTPTTEFKEHRKTWYPWVILFSGLLITGLLVIYLNSTIRRTIQVEQLVSKLSAEITDHKETEEKLLKSEKHYHSLAKVSPVGIFHTDSEGHCSYVNERWCEITGLTLEEAKGEGWSKTLHPDDRDRIITEWYQAIKKKSKFKSEYRFLRPDGVITWVLGQATSEVVANDKVNGYVGTITDITDRKKIEKNIRKLSQAIEQSPTSVIINDSKGNIEYVNPQFTKTTGYSINEVLGKNIRILKSAKQTTKVYKQLWDTITSGKEWRGDLLSKKKNGDHIWELISISPVRDEKNNITHFVNVGIDDTERRYAEEELRKSRASLNEAQRIAHMGNWDWDIENNKLDWSDEIYRIFGLTQHDFGGTYESLLELVHPDDRELVKSLVNEALYERKPYNVDHRIVLPNGTEGIVQQQAEVTFNNEGKPIRMIGTLHDITDRKKIEDELIKKQKLESLGVLAGGIAHDFNNILTAILGNTNLAMLFTKPEEKIYEILNNVQKATERAKELTQQLLTFSRGGTPVKKTVCIAGLIKDTTDFALRGSNVKSEVNISERLWPVEVDEGQINQVVNNLVINGQQAMPEGGILKIKAENISEDDSKNIASLKQGRYVRISIEDKGVGISTDILNKVFDPYFTTKQKGSGLGLASSYSIVKNHGGLITADSTQGAGSIFCVYLPASDKGIVKKKDKLEKPLTGEGKVLIMDDEEMIRDITHMMLTSIGYEVECVKDGDEAIETYNKAKKDGKPFDVVLMDLTIPGGMGGKEAIKKLHQIDPKAKSIVYSGYSNDPILANFQKYGFNGFIYKPFKIQEMSEILQKVIKL